MGICRSLCYSFNFVNMRFAVEVTFFTFFPSCGSIPLTLGLIGTDGGLRTLCHGCGFACEQRVMKTFLGSGYLRSEDEVV